MCNTFSLAIDFFAIYCAIFCDIKCNIGNVDNTKFLFRVIGTVTARVLPHILFNIVINIGTSPAVEVQVCRGRGRRYGRRGGSLTRRVTGPGWGSPGRGVHRDSDGALLVVLLVSRTPATITVHYNHGAGSERAGRGSESVAKPQ